MTWLRRIRETITSETLAVVVIVLIGLWLLVRAQIAEAHIDKFKTAGFSSRDVPKFQPLFYDLLNHDVNLILRLPRRVWSSATGLVQDPLGEAYRIGRWIIAGREVIVCIPKDQSPAAQAQNERLLDHILLQVDRAHGGSIASPVKTALDNGDFPIIVLPRLQDGDSIRDVFTLWEEHLRDQHCRPTPIIPYETTERMRLSKARLDWLWRP